MAKPSSPYAAANIAWATDTNFSSGDESGLTTKAEPAAGVKAQGHVPGLSFCSAHQNWFNYGTAQWIAYLNNLPAETAFTGQSFAWGSDHTWPNFTYTQFASSQARYRAVSPTIGATHGTTGQLWERNVAAMRSVANGSSLYVPLNEVVWQDVDIYEVSAWVTPGAARAGANRTYLSLVSVDLTTGTQSLVTGPVYDDGTTNRQQLTLSIGGYYVNHYATLVYALFVAGNNAATSKDEIDAVLVEFRTADVSPR